MGLWATSLVSSLKTGATCLLIHCCIPSISPRVWDRKDAPSMNCVLAELGKSTQGQILDRTFSGEPWEIFAFPPQGLRQLTQEWKQPHSGNQNEWYCQKSGEWDGGGARGLLDWCSLYCLLLCRGAQLHWAQLITVSVHATTTRGQCS